MATKYRKLSMSIWADGKFRRLTPLKPSGQALWMWLILGPRTTNIPGVVLGTPDELAAALRWDSKAFREAFREALAEGLIPREHVDEEAGLMWLRNGPKHNVPESPNVVRSWRWTWDDIPECTVKASAWRGLKDFTEGLGEGFAKAFAEACRQPSPNQEQEQEQEQERDLVGVGTPTPALSRSDVRRKSADATDVGMRVIRYLGEKAARGGPPLELTTKRKKRIAALLAEGWTFDDFTAVIWLRTLGPPKLRWLGDAKMDQYVRFESLFNTDNAQPNRELARHEYALFNPERARQLGWLPPETGGGDGSGGANGAAHA